MRRCWEFVPEDRPSFADLFECLSTMPRLITPCLADPVPTVLNDGGDTIDRRLSVSKSACNQANDVTCNHDDDDYLPPYQNQFRILRSGSNLSTRSRNASSKKNGTIGNGNVGEPLLPLKRVDSYLTRYVCLQLNKSPDESEAKAVTEVTAV